MDSIFHSVTLDTDKCKGCINCMKRCPTEAIRVRNGKAIILKERCIDCGECIRVCPNKAKKALTDSLDMLKNYKWKVALPAPSFYGQFNNLFDVGYIIKGLKEIGFDDVYEVAAAAEVVSDLSRRLINSDTALIKPVISSACPAVSRLIRVRFPNLCNNVIPILTPAELAAKNAREKAIEETGFKSDEIGIFFISPCPAKVTASKFPLNTSDQLIDGVISATEIYKRIVAPMNKIDELEDETKCGIVGIGWASSGGESAALLQEKYLAADGMENVINILEEVEDGKLDDMEFIELNACVGGCVGGVLNFANPFVSKTRLHRLRKYLPMSCNKFLDSDDMGRMFWDIPLEYTPVMKLSDDKEEALRMQKLISELANKLPGLDCGSCGAPSCEAFAEDVIKGFARMDYCILMSKGEDADNEYVPIPFRKEDKE